MQELPLEKLDACWNAPEKAVLVTSVDAQGRANIIAVGWLMRANISPPVYAIGINDRSHSGRNIAATLDFVIGVPGAELARAVMFCGTHTGAEVDKFAACGLTSLPARTVRAPLIGECLANLECRVVGVQHLEDHRVFFGQVQACWVAAGREGRHDLLIVGQSGGWQVAYEEKGFRLGTVRD
ncbi:MAG: flavin reductase family protein [Candidatus Latescibacterota bacterium]